MQELFVYRNSRSKETSGTRELHILSLARYEILNKMRIFKKIIENEILRLFKVFSFGWIIITNFDNHPVSS